MKGIIKKLIPKFLWEPFAIVANFKDQKALSLHLRDHVGRPLTEGQIANLRVLTNRQKLFENLPKGGVVAEIGVLRGDSSSEILALNQPAKLHLLDAWDLWHGDKHGASYYQLVQQRFAEQVTAGAVEIRKGWSSDVLPTFPDTYFDWVFLDSSHVFENVRRELALLESKIKPGGFIAGKKYTAWSLYGRSRYGVVEAVNEFCLENGWELAFLTLDPASQLCFAIRKPNS